MAFDSIPKGNLGSSSKCLPFVLGGNSLQPHSATNIDVSCYAGNKHPGDWLENQEQKEQVMIFWACLEKTSQIVRVLTAHCMLIDGKGNIKRGPLELQQNVTDRDMAGCPIACPMTYVYIMYNVHIQLCKTCTMNLYMHICRSYKKHVQLQKTVR